MTQPGAPVQLEYGRPEPPKRQPFGLSWWTLLPALLMVAGQITAEIQKSGGTGQRGDFTIGVFTGRCIASFLIAMFIAWVAWFVCRRSRTAANIGFVMMALLMAIVGFTERSVQQGKAIRIASIQLQSLVGLKNAADQAQKRLESAGGFDFVPPKTAEEAQARLTLANDFHRKLRAYLDAGDQSSANVAAQAGESNATDSVVAQLEKKMNWPVQRPILVDIDATCKTGVQMLAFLADRPGKWRWTESGYVMDDARDTARFDVLAEAFVKAVQAMQLHAQPATTQPQ